jgi:CheY-like chemotaxis protein
MAEKILIIDDDLDTLRLVGLMLQKQGYQIVAANNGAQGLEKANEEYPDLILLDVMMPEMDGYEVARRLRQNPKTNKIPILMFTAKSQLDDKVSGFESGADDYLTKPTHPTELHAHVKALLARAASAIDPSATADKKAFVVGLLSVRGGLGVSTISLNLGSYLQSEIKSHTIVAEIQQGTGTMGLELGFEKYDGFAALLQSPSDTISGEKVKEALNKHKSGLQLLLASEQPKDTPLIESLPQYKAVYKHLASMPEYLLLDFGAGLPRITQALLPQCDHVIVLIEGVQNTITHSKLLLKDLEELGLDESKITIIMNNRFRSEQLLSLSQVEKGLDAHITVTFTPAPELHVQAARLKSVGILLQEEGITKQQFKKLAQTITELKADET